jgi:hypothetical protein
MLHSDLITKILVEDKQRDLRFRAKPRTVDQGRPRRLRGRGRR